MEKTKKCPYCGEEILAVAKKCRYCGEWLNEPAQVQNADPSSSGSCPPPIPVEVLEKQPPTEDDLYRYNKFPKQVSFSFWVVVVGFVLSMFYTLAEELQVTGGIVGFIADIGSIKSINLGDCLNSFASAYMLSCLGVAIYKLETDRDGGKKTIPILLFMLAGVEVLGLIPSLVHVHEYLFLIPLLFLAVLYGHAGEKLRKKYKHRLKRIGYAFIANGTLILISLKVIFEIGRANSHDMALRVILYLILSIVQLYGYYQIKVVLTKKEN